MKKIYVFALLAAHVLAFYSQAQDIAKNDAPADSAKGLDVFNMSLEELMNVKVVSASKKSEKVFDAPLSVGSVSKDEIKRSGATSIMEALRLVPGLIVRETTQGNYDIHIRGFDNLPYIAPMNSATNTISLVMIDNRPVYNYFNGGTFWETLPVDINDVERIEVVRGPASALYGPNAAAGVINIITRKPEKEGLYVVANAQGGMPRSVITNASVGYKTKKFDFVVSGNQAYRERTETNYYSWLQKEKMPVESLPAYFPQGLLSDPQGIPNAKDRYPNQNVALNKFGINAFLNYHISEKSSIGISAGTQNSQAQKTFVETLATPLTNSLSNTSYVDARVKLDKLSAQVSYNGGTQNAGTGVYGWKYDFRAIDAFAEYDFTFKNFSVKPGLNYRTATYDDSKYATNKQGFINGSYNLNNIAGSLRAEYKLFDERLKFIGAIRFDQYNNPNKIYTSYQLAGNFKINDNNLIRAVYSRAFRGPTLFDVYSSQSLPVGTQQVPGVPFNVNSNALILGDRNIKLLSVDMIELGYRVKVTENLHFDLDVFYQQAKNFTNIVNDSANLKFIDPAGGFTPANTRVDITQIVVNMPLVANQRGLTLSANYVVNKFQIKPFITIQQTQLSNVSRSRSTENYSPGFNYKDQVYDTLHKSTPTIFGGFYANYTPTSKWNINLNAYFFSENTYSDISNRFLIDLGNDYGRPKAAVKVLLNAKIAYKVIDKLGVFVNVRNTLNQRSVEFAQTDITKFTWLVGANFEF